MGRTGPFAAFRQGMRDRGWVEGHNLALEARFSDRDQAPRLVAELHALKVDLFVAEGLMAIRARAEVGSTPLVFAFSGDPVEAKLVMSLARPGGNMTAVTAMSWDLVAKRLQLLKEALPALERVAVIANPAHPGAQSELKAPQSSCGRIRSSSNVVLPNITLRRPGRSRCYQTAEEHSGDWRECQRCRKEIQAEMYVFYGTSEYNFVKLENPPGYKPNALHEVRQGHSPGRGRVHHEGQGLLLCAVLSSAAVNRCRTSGGPPNRAVHRTEARVARSGP